jgi:serine/threonine-protein kinase
MATNRDAEIRRICEEALDRPVDERAQFVSDACAGDDNLRHEIDALLAHDPSADRFLARPAFESEAVYLANAAASARRDLVGRRLGTYDIVSLIGSGGMGTVYRARDTKLNRDVAIKLLPNEFAADGERLARFTREAHVLASLNHPRIATIYGLDEANGTPFLVLEFVDGETLDRRLARGRVPFDEALAVAKQIAEALEAAHEKGIVHRDLKPANIAVTRAGIVKVLDFGLAKDTSPEMPPSISLSSPTLTSPMLVTHVGVIVGTVAYMSPEQARGKVVDRRTDVWAFGCVLFEMLSGRRAFAGATATDVIANVVHKPPPWDALPAATPAAVRTLLQRCLAKDPAQRLRAIGDAHFDLDMGEPAPTAVAAPRRRRLLIAVSAIAVPLVAVGLVLGRRLLQADRPAARSAMQFEIELQTTGSLGSEVGTDVIISPDGARIVFVSRGADGVPRLKTRRFDQATVFDLPGTEGARSPFFSPDGEWVAFEAAGSLKKTAVGGGSPIVLREAVNLLGGSWGDDGAIYAALDFGKLWRVSSSSGEARVIADLTPESQDPRWPQVLPGSKHLLVTAVGRPGPNGATIEALSLIDGTRKTLVPRGTFGRYLPGGYLTYVNQGTLFALRVDLDRMQVLSDAPIPVVKDVAYSWTFGFAQLDIARNGTLVYRRSAARGELAGVSVDSSGATETVMASPAEYAFPSLSPDGRRIAVARVENGAPSLWIFDRVRKHIDRVSALPDSYGPTWTRDGRMLIVGGLSGMRWLTPDGAHSGPLTNSNAAQVPWSLSADGSRLAYHETSPVTGFDIWTVPVRENADGLTAGQPEVFLHTSAYETYPAFSPDGRWIAYGSGAFGTWEVYVRSFPDTGAPPVQVSRGGGRIPRWLPNRRELFYRTDDQQIMVSSYGVKNGVFVAGPPRPWPMLRLAETGVLSNFDIDADGRHIFALVPARPEDEQHANHVTVQLNFLDQLHQLVDRQPK